MIYLAQTPNQTLVTDDVLGGDVVFRQMTDSIHIITVSGNIANIMPIIMAFPQRMITFNRMNCPDNVALTLARLGFTVFPKDGMTTFTYSKE